MTLDEIKNIAIERSASLNAQEMEVRALQNEVSLMGKWQNPQLMGQFGGLKAGVAREGLTAELSFTQPIPLSNKFTVKKEMAEVAKLQQERQTSFFKNWVGHQAILSAWRVYVNYELYQHGIERAKRLQLIKKYIDSRPRISSKQKVEASLIESSLLQLERMQDQKSHELNLSLSDFEFWTGKKLRPQDLSLNIPESINFDLQEKIDFSKNLEVTAAKGQLEVAELDKNLAIKERRPDLFLGAGYRVEDVVPVNRFSYGIIGINIPIWDTGHYRKEAANARYQRDQKQFEEVQRQVELKLRKQLQTVQYTIGQVKKFPKSFIKSQEKAIQIAEEGFKQGVVDVNTLLMSETQSHEVIDQVFVSWMDYLVSTSTFQLLKGEEFVWQK